ncbi:MAG: alcohol dehydrogenase catalytic domain-containing protein, partial [Rubrivivax sp.]|nr:alcohol dehydrogenase catalytic domain-containing protein [Rubrivivax sp.]
MKIDAYRWLMTAPGVPLERQAFAAEPGAGEVVVAVAGCGVCHTDLGYFYDGVRTNHPLPLALGHEISGHVVAAGDGAAAWLGRAVIVPAVLPCGECD